MLQMTMIDSINMPARVLSTMTITADPSPCCMQGKQYLSSMMPEHFGYQLQSSVKQPMALNSYRLYVEDSTDVHVITSMNVIQMLSSQTCLIASM